MAEVPQIHGERLSKDYLRLLFASVVDNVGDGAFAAAIPLLAVRLSHSPVLISVVSGALTLPWILFSLPVGAMVDRYDRKSLMVSSQLFQAAVMLLATILIASHCINTALLAVLAFALGAGDVVFGNASQVVVPELVPSHLLNKANGYQNTAVYVGQLFVGPPLGSLLFVLSASAPFGLNAVSFVGSVAILLTLAKTRQPPVEGGHPPIGFAVKEGLSWLLGNRQLRTLAMLLGINTFCFALANSTLVLLATRTLGVTSGGYGLLLAAAAVGGSLGGLLNARLVDRLGPRTSLLASLTTTIVAFELVGLAPDVGVLAALLAVSGFATTVWNVLALTLRQQQVPPELRGRVNSVYRMVGWGLMPFGALVGGVVADTMGFRAPFPVAGAVRAVALVVALPSLMGAASSFRVEPGERVRGSRS